MDHSLHRFRAQLRRELGDRQGAERRYSPSLREHALAYWREREAAGDGLGTVAQALGVSAVSLRRWAAEGRFRPVAVVTDPAERGCVIMIRGDEVRIEGLDLEAAVQFVTRLR